MTNKTPVQASARAGDLFFCAAKLTRNCPAGVLSSRCFVLYHIYMKSVWIEYNPNPAGRRVGDCAVRAISAALDIDWERAYSLIAANGYRMGDMPSSDSVWGSVLRQHGFYRSAIPDTCPDCYTAADFARDHPRGVYVLGFGGHVATVRDGHLYDAWDSSTEIPQFVWYKKEGQ